MSTASVWRGMPRRAHCTAQKSAHRDAFGLMPWLTCRARSENLRPGESLASADRSAMESGRPDRPPTRGAPGAITGASAAATLSGRSLELGFLELPITHQALEALLDELLGTLVAERAQRVAQRALEVLRHRVRVAVRAAQRLVDHLVDQGERLEAARGYPQRFRGLGRLVRALPEDRGAPFRRNDRIRRVLEHHHRVAHGDRERAARAALADHRAHNGHLELRHDVQAVADRLPLAALLGADPGIGAGRIDERKDGNVELLGEAHEPHRLAVAFGPRHAEVPGDLLLGVSALLVPDDHDRLAVETAEPADDRGVIGERTVAVQ